MVDLSIMSHVACPPLTHASNSNEIQSCSNHVLCARAHARECMCMHTHKQDYEKRGNIHINVAMGHVRNNTFAMEMQ
jgi:hypothetical protein